MELVNMNNDTGLLEPSVDREQIFNESRTNTDLILNTNNDGLISSNTIDRVIPKSSSKMMYVFFFQSEAWFYFYSSENIAVGRYYIQKSVESLRV